jgi:hypothetical protein
MLYTLTKKYEYTNWTEMYQCFIGIKKLKSPEHPGIL